MDLPPFRLNQWLDHFDFADPPIACNLAGSTGPRWLLRELLAIGGDAPALDGLALGYAPAGGGKARALVIGNAFIFSDRVAERSRSSPVTFDMIGVAIDWLRDKPVLATTVESKTYKEYQPPEPTGVDTTRLVYLPLGLALLLVGGVGTGVWVMRRK